MTDSSTQFEPATDPQPAASGVDHSITEIPDARHSADPVTDQDIADAVVVLRGMAYEHRLHILVLLMAGETTPESLATRMSLDSTIVAHHLRNLRDTSLIRRQRRGRHVYYALNGDAARGLVQEVIRYAGRRRESGP